MLRALHRFLGTGVAGDRRQLRPRRLPRLDRAATSLEDGPARVFAGEYVVVELPTLEVEAGGERHAAVNDVVVTSSIIGRMIELAWAIGGEDLGRLACDGMICSTPSGSTAYNLSNGGPGARLGASTRWRSPSSRRTRCTRARSSSRGAATSSSGTGRATSRVAVLVGRQARAGQIPLGRPAAVPPRAGAKPARDAARGDLLPFSALPGDTLVLRSLRIENLVLIREAELELAPGLNAITGETGAGKTILAQAIGLLLGARATRPSSGPAPTRPTSRPSSTCRRGCSTRRASEALAELRPEGEEGLVLARRVFADGRTRAYAWGRARARGPRRGRRAAARDVRASSSSAGSPGPSYQLDVLDAFCGEEQQRRRAEARRPGASCGCAPPPRRADPRRRGGGGAARRAARARRGHRGPGAGAEEALRAERERLRHVTELVEAAAAAAEALAAGGGRGRGRPRRRSRARRRRRERLAPELAQAGDELRDAELRLRETASALRGFLAALEAEPARVEQVEAGLDRIAEAKRRYRCESYEELLARAAEARAELDALEDGADPLAAAAAALRGRDAGRRPRRGARDARVEPPRALSPTRSPPSCAGSASARASSGSSCASATRAPPARTRWPSWSGRTAGSRSRRRRRPPPAASSRASRSRSPRSRAARRWSSTRSTPASAGRRRTRSGRRSRASPSARR